MLRQIVLHGHLKELYAGELHFEVDTVAEAVRACCSQVPGFDEAFREGSYRVSVKDEDPENDIDMDTLHFKLGETSQIHFIPVVAGAKGGGGKAILGIAMIGLAFAFPLGLGFASGSLWGSAGFASALGGIGISSAAIGKLGIALVLGGVSSMLSPKVKNEKPQNYERPDQRPSFLFNGPVNATEQGGPVPLVYGRCRVGSYVVSTGLVTENI